MPFPAINEGDDLSGYIADVEATSPDAVVVIAVKGSDTVALLTAMVGTPLTTARFFFTDGSKDTAALLESDLDPEVVAIIQNAKGTAPALPEGANYDLFATNLDAEFDLQPSSFAFLAQSYDATFIGAWGTVYAETTNVPMTGASWPKASAASSLEPT